jgi:hypothetical protein
MVDLDAKELDDLLSGLALYHNDPLGFVQHAFPWGEGELSRASGPEVWQAEILTLIRDGLSPDKAVAIAVASGHGIGKSALISWIILWSLSTETDTRVVVTANTESQLRTKTWPELAKWYRLCVARPLFKLEATSLLSIDVDHVKTWRADMIPWSERNPEAFAGLHNQGRRVVMLYDEGSAIPDIIFETSEGFMSDADTERLWLVFGNPTRSTGRFRECFPGGRHAASWISRQVDSRSISFTNKDRLRELADAYGEDSDYFRVRVKGEFPRVGAIEFISAAVVAEARARDTESQTFDPLIIGVDVARFGDDETVIVVRKGRDARSYSAVRLRGLDTMQVASRVIETAQTLRADTVFIDEGGVGGGVVDRCRQLRLFVLGVQFGGKADRSDLVTQGERYANKRAEIWGTMRAWLLGGMIEDNDDLRDQLVGPSYGFNARDEIQLERKEDMRRRGIPSPDWADALAITFAYPVMPNEMAGGEHVPAPMYVTEYNPYEAAGLSARVAVAALARALEVILMNNRRRFDLMIVVQPV